MKGCKVLLTVVIGLMTVSWAVAQQETVVANVPFDFSVHDTTLPAGEYKVSVTGDHLLCISSVKGKDHLFVTINSVYSATPMTQSELVFHRYGHQYFLSEVWVAATETGDSLPATKRERQSARNGTGNVTAVIAQVAK
jgi:hypothetical protein